MIRRVGREPAIDYLIICIVALAVSALTFLSGFGLGTLLMPAFALFFPLPVAIAATAVVHLANNLFKLVLVGRHADRQVVLRFAVPAVLAAFAGAAALSGLGGLEHVIEASLAGWLIRTTPLKLVVGAVIVSFALIELTPRFARWSLPARYLPVGGLVSGFFGGLTGNQGAFRAAFLIKAGLGKEAFVATGVVSSVMVDSARLLVYVSTAVLSGAAAGTAGLLSDGALYKLVIVASVSAFVGALAGRRLLEKTTLRGVQLVVAAGMIGIGTAMATGLV